MPLVVRGTTVFKDGLNLEPALKKLTFFEKLHTQRQTTW